jgi:hypothetical protein
MRRSIVLAAALAIAAGTAHAESVIRYGISLADIPLTAGQPDAARVPINSPGIPSTTRWSHGR